MREILFRGYSTAQRKWFYGDLIHSPDINHPCICNKDAFVNVSKSTIGQYTGLTDKNGKKIFEGDILDCGDRIVFVEYNRYCATFDSRFICYQGKQNSNGIENADWKYRAVIIGNTTDNPELLKGGVDNG